MFDASSFREAASQSVELAVPVTTPKYQYLVCDLLTDRLWDSVQFTGVKFDRRVSRAGSWSGQLRVSNRTQALQADSLSKNCGRLAVWVLRNKQLWWGGILWGAKAGISSRSYDTVDFQGATFESFPDRLFLDYDWPTDEDSDMTQKVMDIWAAMQGYENIANIDVVTDYDNIDNPAYDFLPSAFMQSDLTTYGEMIQAYCDDPSAGIDYTINVYLDGNGNRIKMLRTAGSFKAVETEAPPIISGYRIPSWGIDRSTDGMGTTFQAWVNQQQSNVGEDTYPIHSNRYLSTQLINEGWPRLDVRKQLEGTFDASQAYGVAQAYAQQMRKRQSGIKDVVTYDVDLSTSNWHPNLIGQNVIVKHSKKDLWRPGMTSVAAPVVAEFTAPERGQLESVKFTFDDTREVTS